MNQYICHRATGPIDTMLKLPGSKSLTNRALVTAALADGDSLLRGMLLADDTRLMVDALRALGIAITIDEQACVAEVTGCRGRIPESEASLFCGNSGTTIRFCTALAALGHGTFHLDGVARMRQRPIGALGDVLGSLGAGIEYGEASGYPPLTVHASGLQGGQVAFRSPASSQQVSALMMAGPKVFGDLMIAVTGDIPSRPYIQMTADVMESFGASLITQFDTKSVKVIIPAPQVYSATHYDVEPDASNASYFFAAPAIAGGRLTVEGLGTSSIQGDARFVDVLQQMGCRITQEQTRTTVEGPQGDGILKGVDVDLGDMPDTAQTLAVTALFAEGTTTIRNIGSLRIKETDRMDALSKELAKTGAKVEINGDAMIIQPPVKVQPAHIDTYDDHRMAMSFALAGLGADGIVINDPDCCAKTFPTFFKVFELATKPMG